MLASQKIRWILGLSLLILVTGLTCHHFLTQPRVWTDEALNVQMAKTLAETGTINIPLAPGVFSSHTYRYTSSSGWVVLASLALIFKIFGSSFFVARSVMATYLIGFVIFLFFFLQQVWDVRRAFLATLLVATFASFYANGKSVLGEVPAAFWLLLGFYCLQVLEARLVWRSILGGLGFGLFFATKPAFLILGLPALGLILLIQLILRKESWRFFLLFWLVITICIAPTVWFGMIHPISGAHLQETLAYYSNNYQARCIACDIQNNLRGFFTRSTFWHLDLLLLATAIALVWQKRALLRDWRVQWLLAYSAVSILYFIKSPGTNRYLLHVQILGLILFPWALFVLWKRFFVTRLWLPTALVIILAVLQLVQFFWFSEVYASDTPIVIERLIQAELAPRGDLIGIIATPVAAAPVPLRQLVQYISMNGRTDGQNPLSLPADQLPHFIIYSLGSVSLAHDLNPYEAVLDRWYQIKTTFEQGKYVVLEKKS